MGRKKACDVSEGTWLLPVELAGRPPLDPDVLGVKLPLLPERPLRSGCAALEDTPVLAVPGRDSEANKLLLLGLAVGVLLCTSCSPPSSEAMSVIRDEIMLGGPATSCRGYCGKLSSLLLLAGEGVERAVLSP